MGRHLVERQGMRARPTKRRVEGSAMSQTVGDGNQPVEPKTSPSCLRAFRPSLSYRVVRHLLYWVDVVPRHAFTLAEGARIVDESIESGPMEEFGHIRNEHFLDAIELMEACK